MGEARRHTLHLSDHDVAVIERSLRTRHRMLGLMGDMRSTGQINDEADLLAHTASLVQEHMRACDCSPPPPPRPKRRPGTTPIEDRKVV